MTDKGYEDIAMPFGSYKGVLLADVPSTYLRWLIDQEFVEEKYPKIWKLARMEEQYRITFNIKI